MNRIILIDKVKDKIEKYSEKYSLFHYNWESIEWYLKNSKDSLESYCNKIIKPPAVYFVYSGDNQFFESSYSRINILFYISISSSNNIEIHIFDLEVI